MNTIDRLKALEKAATAGVWCADGDAVVIAEDYTISENSRAKDAEFIAAAQNAIGPLLKVAEAAKAYHDMATSRYDSSRVAEFERKQDALGEALAELEAQ